MLPKSLIKFYFQVFKEKKLGIIAYYFCIMFYKTTNYVMPALFVKFLIGALESKPVGLLTMQDVLPVLVCLSIWILCLIFSDIGNTTLEMIVYPETKKITHVKIYRYLINRSVAFYKKYSAGYLQSQAKYIIDGTWNLIFKYPCLFCSMIFSVLLNFGMLFDLNIVFALLIGLILSFRLFYGLTRCKKLSESYVEVSVKAAEVNAKNIDILSNFLNLKIFGNSYQEKKYIGNYYEPWVETKKRTLLLQLKFFALPMIFEFLVLILILFLSTSFYIQGQMSLADISFVITAFFSLRSCVVNFVWEIPDFLEYYASAYQAYKKITTISPEIENVKTGSKKCDYNSMIEFKNVSFKYEDDFILKDINLCISKGEKIGVVGPSGSGKTTLVNLLMHLYDTTEGCINIDGKDIRTFSSHSLKQTMSYVPQESILFNRSLLENISYGVPNASKRQIISAAKKAQAHDFIIASKDGYDTVVGDRGIKLSGGQRQRITIAHAILKNSPILLLDEATSALDSETENKIQESLEYLMKSRTTIAIAHRLSTLKSMDRIIVMDKGRIVAEGTHEFLMQNCSVYSKLWKMQYSGFI